MEQIRQRVIDELFILAMFERLYTAQMTLICNWLTERLERALNAHQVNCLSQIIKVKLMIISQYSLNVKLEIHRGLN